jgi:hypothetical protein
MPTVDELNARDTQLTRSFAAAVASLFATMLWTYFLAPTDADGLPQVSAVSVVLSLIQLGCYVWYAIAAGAAARTLGDAGWKYIAWILAAPFLAMLPIPIVSMLIGVSPLSIKFLLGSRLQAALHQETMTTLHGA